MPTKTKALPLWVDIREAKPNEMFTEEQRQSVRFLIYSKKIECAECGSREKVMWTMLCEFYAMNMGLVSIEKGKKLRPLTPVCEEHLLKPAFD